MLYKRDYKILTIEESVQLDKAEAYLQKNRGEFGEVTPNVLHKYHDSRPEASYYYKSFFPNNYLFPKELNNKIVLKKTEDEFKALLNSNPSERQILNYINENNYYNLIASIFHSGFTFGHHDAYLFKEFELTSTYKADYLLIGKNSHRYHFIFVELENPTGSITNKDGSFGTTVRKGIKQVEDWDKWLEGNFSALSLIFEKLKSSLIELPKEFRTLDKTRLNYVVISGRRHDFNENTYSEKRRLLRSKNIHLLHYDNIIDSYRTFYDSSNY